MIVGKVYGIKFIPAGAKKIRISYMRFVDKQGVSPNAELVFDLRPLAGTQRIRESEVLEITEPPDTQDVALPKMWEA